MSVKSLYLIFLVLGTCSFAFGQNGVPSTAGARGLAMGDASVTYHDIYSSFSNQAGLAFLETISASIHAESRFLLPELKVINGAVAYPTSLGTFGMTISYYGYDLYNEQKIGLSYARKLFEDVSIGAQFDYIGTRISEYGSSAAFTFELGIQAKLLDVFRIAAHVFSPVRISIAEDEVLPSVFKVGAGWEASKKLLITLEVEKDIDFPASFKGGIEYFIVDKLAIRAGVSTQPVRNSFGLGLYLGSLTIDIASSYHQELGFTPSVGFSFMGKKKTLADEEN